MPQLDPTADAKIETQIAELKQKLLAEHKQKLLSIEKMAERMEDDQRAKAADEMMWLEFETRMRGLIRRVIEPALMLSVEDRETNIDLEFKIQ